MQKDQRHSVPVTIRPVDEDNAFHYDVLRPIRDGRIHGERMASQVDAPTHPAAAVTIMCVLPGLMPFLLC